MTATWPGFWSANLEGTVARMNAGVIGYGTAAEIGALSTSTYAGCLMYATDTKQLWYCNGATWAAVAVGLNLAETIAGIKTFSSIPVLPASDPTTDNQAVRKAFLETALDTNLYTAWAAISTAGETEVTKLSELSGFGGAGIWVYGDGNNANNVIRVTVDGTQLTEMAGTSEAFVAVRFNQTLKVTTYNGLGGASNCSGGTVRGNYR